MNDRTTPARPRSETGTPLGWLRTEIDRLFEDFGPPRSVFSFAQPAPALEMTANDKEYRLTAELPGLGEEDIDLSVADGVLTLRGEKRDAADEKQDGYLLRERRYGSFERRLVLPDDIDVAKVHAEFHKGVLAITLPKDADAVSRTRKIAITAKS